MFLRVILLQSAAAVKNPDMTQLTADIQEDFDKVRTELERLMVAYEARQQKLRKLKLHAMRKIFQCRLVSDVQKV